MDAAKPAKDVSTGSGPVEGAAIETSTDPRWPPAPGRSPQAIACEPYRESIEAGVRQGRTAVAIWRDLVDDHGFASAYASVKRFVAKLREEAPRDAQQKVRGMRFESLEEAQTCLERWERPWADMRIYGTTKRQVAEMYAEEKPHLLPLPVEPSRCYQDGEPGVRRILGLLSLCKRHGIPRADGECAAALEPGADRPGVPSAGPTARARGSPPAAPAAAPGSPLPRRGD